VLARALRRKWRLGGPLIALCGDRNREHARFPHSRNRQRFALLTAGPAVLDKAGGDMVHLRVNLRPLKENDAARIIVSLAFID